MRASFPVFVAALGSLIVSAVAQGPPPQDPLPECARSCVKDSAVAACGNFDLKCICSQLNLVEELSCCLSKSCSPEDSGTMMTFAHDACADAGVTNLPTEASCKAPTRRLVGDAVTQVETEVSGSVEDVEPATGAAVQNMVSTGAGAVLGLLAFLL